MTLTWKEFLNLATLVKNLRESMGVDYHEKIDIKVLNRQVAEAAQKYLDFNKEGKYMEFTESMRIG